MEVDIGKAFGKKINAMTWSGDNMCVLRLEGDLKLLFYIDEEVKLSVEAVVNEDLTNR